MSWGEEQIGFAEAGTVPQWRDEKSWSCPCFISAFLTKYLRKREGSTEVMLDLWAHAGLLLPPIAEALSPTRAMGFVPDQGKLEQVRQKSVTFPVEWSLTDPLAALAESQTIFDVVVGIPPWRWRPNSHVLTSRKGEIELLDDPANIAIVKACASLGEDGVGFFIVAPGFILRPGPQTVFPNLKHFGLGVEALISLPRGLFMPDTGTGRFLVALSRQRPHAPLAGTLRDDQDSTTQILDGLTSVQRTNS